MPRLDVQADVRGRLAEALAPVPVMTHVPDPRPQTLVVVTRAGGRQLDFLRDRPGVDVLMWAPTEDEAADLAHDVSDAMEAMPFEGGYARVEEETIRSDYDVKGGSPRWYASYTITTYLY